MTAVPRGIGAPAMRALMGAGLTTLEDVVDAGRSFVAELHGVGQKAMGVLDEAVAAAGMCDREDIPLCG